MITIWSTLQKAGRNFQNWPVDVFNQKKHASAKTARLPSHNARTKSESLSIWREKTGYTITHKNGHKAAHGYYMITPQNASHPGVSSSRLLYRSENFTPVRKIAPVSRKQIGLHWWQESVVHALCLRLWIASVFYQHEVYLQIAEIRNDPSSC